MKTTLSICLFVFTFIGFSSNLYCQQKATKTETVNWIKSRLDYHQQWEDKDFFGMEVIKYDYKNDILYYKHHAANQGEAHTAYWVYEIPMKDINPDRIRPVRLAVEDGVGIEINTNYGKESIISKTYKYPSGKHSMTDEYNTLTIKIPMNVFNKEGKEAFVYRIIKAFMHLIDLAGGEGEKF